MLRAQGMNIQTSSVSLCFRRCGQSASPPSRQRQETDGRMALRTIAKHETRSAILCQVTANTQCCNYMQTGSFFCSVSHTQNILPLSIHHTHSDRHYANLAPLLCHWWAGWAARCSPALFALGPLPHVLTEHPLIVGISPACLDKPGEVEERRNREGGREGVFCWSQMLHTFNTDRTWMCVRTRIQVCLHVTGFTSNPESIHWRHHCKNATFLEYWLTFWQGSFIQQTFFQ